MGGNGSGKSTALRSIQWLLSGTFPGYGGRERKIRTGADKATGTLVFTHQGVDVEVTRHLHISRASLKYGDEPTISGADAVNARIMALLGVSGKLMGQYVFVSQGETTSVLRATPARRMEAFHLLFGLDSCEKIRKALADELQVYVPISLAVNRDQVLQRAKEASARLAEVETRLGELTHPDMDQLPALREQVAALTAVSTQLNHALTGLEATRRQVQQTEASLHAAEAQLRQAREREDLARQTVDRLRDSASRQRAAVEQRAHIQQMRSARDSTLTTIFGLEQQMAQLQAPVPVADDDAAVNEIVATSLKPMEARAQTMKSFIDGFAAGSCPTCGTHRIVDAAGQDVDIAAKLREYSAALQNLQPTIDALRQEVDGYFAMRRQNAAAVADYTSRHQDLASRLETARKQLAMLPDVPEPVADGAEQIVAQFAEAERDYAHSTATIRSSQEAAMQHMLDLNVARSRLEELEQLATTSTTELPSLAARVASAERALAERQTLQGRYTELLAQVQQLDRQARELEMLEARNSGVTHYRRLLSEASGVLHRDAFPAAFGGRFFTDLDRGWNEMLRHLDVPCTVRLNPDASVVLRFEDGERMIEEASGGQLCCLSLAFLLEVNRRFASSIGFMTLDEPTDGVDSAHLDRVRGLFQEAQRYTSGSGTQLLVVTHAEQLSPGFNHVMRLT